MPYASILAEPALPAWHEARPDSSLFPSQGDIFQGGLDSPLIKVPSFNEVPPQASHIGPAVASAAVAPNVGAANAQLRPVGVFSKSGTTGTGSDVGQVIQNGAQIVRAIATVGSVVGRIQNGNSGGSLGNFGPKPPGNLKGALQGFKGADGFEARPSGAVLRHGNPYNRALDVIAVAQQLLTANQQSFSNTNVGRTALSAYTNLMQMGMDDTSSTLKGQIDTSTPPATSCGAPSSLTAAQKERWNAQFNRMNKLIKGSALEGTVPADGAKHGITTGSSEEWAAFYANLGVQESGNQNHVVGDQGKFVGDSNGIYQLSPLDYANYRSDMEKAGLTPGTTIDGKPAFTVEQLRDPDINSRATIAISERLIKQDGAIGGNSTTGMAKYWGPLRRGWTACG